MSMKPNVKYTSPIIKQIKAESQKETRTEDRTTKEWTLWTACSDGELEKVQSMMKPLKDDKEFDINWCDPELKRTSLYRACGIGGKLEVVKLLLDNFPNIDLNKPNSEGGSPLFIACQSNHVEIAKLLLSLKGVNPNQPIHDGETCLTAACANGKEEIVSLLLSRPDIDPNVSKKNGTTPLWFAAQHGKLNIVKSLFASPKEIKTTIISNWNSTLPKVWAKMRGFTEIAALIEEYERDPKKVRESIWREKKLYVQTFVHGILFADGYYRLKFSSAEEQEEEEAKAKRYFQIVSKLPIEIQMMIAHKSMGSNGIFVLSHNTEATLRDILIGSS